MAPLQLCISLLPICVYLLMLGIINLSSRPLVVSGGRDLGALALAIMGLVIVGPMNHFLPEGAVYHFGSFVWILLLGLYAMIVVLIILMRLPRLVVYNIDAKTLYSVLAEVSEQLDTKSQWQGSALLLPELGVHLSFEPQTSMRNVQLISVGRRQNLLGWRKLEGQLNSALADVTVPRNPRGWSMLIFAFVSAGIICLQITRQPLEVAEALRDLLRL